MKDPRTLLAAVALAGAAVLAFLALGESPARAQAGAAALEKGFAGKTVELYFREQHPQHTGFDIIFSLDAVVTAVADEGLFVRTSKKWVNNTYWAGENDVRVESNISKEYAHRLFVPWEALKYVKIKD